MQFRAAMSKAFTAVMFAALVGCGSSASVPGTMSVHLVDGPEPQYKAIYLVVEKLEIHGPNGWETLKDFVADDGAARRLDLLSLKGVDEKGVPIKATLVQDKGLTEGHYDQMRLKLGSGNQLILPDDTAVELKVPSGTQSGVKFPVSFDVAPNTTRDVFIDMDAHRSIFVHQTGGSAPKYLLRPVIHAVDRLVTGYITGTLTTSAGGPLVGVRVMAETADGIGHPNVVRQVETGADGRYVLDLLPVGGSYYVVAQPVTAAGVVYPPKASGPKAISETVPSATYDASFDAVLPTSVGSVSGTITPLAAANQDDYVVVMSMFGTTKLVVRIELADVAPGYLVANLPLYDGGYTLAVERATEDGSGGHTFKWKDDGGAPILGETTTGSLNLTNRILTAPATP